MNHIFIQCDYVERRSGKEEGSVTGYNWVKSRDSVEEKAAYNVINVAALQSTFKYSKNSLWKSCLTTFYIL